MNDAVASFCRASERSSFVFTFYQVGEKWLDGLCIECECRFDNGKSPVSKCLRKTCTKIEEHPDKKEYVLEEIPIPGTCCPKIVRTACIEDGEEVKVCSRLWGS